MVDVTTESQLQLLVEPVMSSDAGEYSCRAVSEGSVVAGPMSGGTLTVLGGCGLSGANALS